MPRFLTAALLASTATPAFALTPAGVFLDAAVEIQFIIVLLVGSVVAAGVVAVRKLAAGSHLTGGSTYLSALRFGGPMVGLFAATYVAFMGALGIANSPTPPPSTVLAPGWAEMILLFGLGLFTGCAATVLNWLVEARIDRSVLRS